jgi:RNA polymerase sigma factor (sigma-70 family)
VPDKDPSCRPHWFTTSHWSLILTAGDVNSDASRAALEQLFTQYWYPLYAFARRRGYLDPAAQDLTQGFFLHLLEKGCLRAADPSRGRFRTFLLTAFKNFLANEWDHSRAQKRGGGQPTLSLDGAQERFHADAHDPVTPETSFDREWAESLVTKALHDLRDEMSQAGNQNRFSLLKVYLLGETPSRTYQDVGRELGLTENAVKVAVHRMRRRLGELLRNEIAQTVQDARIVDDELRYLMQALSR